MMRGDVPRRESTLRSDLGPGCREGWPVSYPFPPKEGRKSRCLSRGKADDGQRPGPTSGAHVTTIWTYWLPPNQYPISFLKLTSANPMQAGGLGKV